jgi:hypothetical protein
VLKNAVSARDASIRHPPQLSECVAACGAVEDGPRRWFFRYDARYTAPRPVLDAAAADEQR